MKNKKAQGTQNLALIILVVISLIIGIVFIFKSGILETSQTFFCPTIITANSRIRGSAIKKIDDAYEDLITHDDSKFDLPGRFQKGIQAGFAKHYLEEAVTDIKEGIPILTCTNPEINLGFNTPCGKDNGVTKEKFFKTVSDRTLDCWNMYTSGYLNPLKNPSKNADPQNPRTCFVIQFNIQEPVSFYDIIDYMQEVGDYSEVTTAPGGSGIYVEGDERTDISGDPTEKQIKKGILFITYADAGGSSWENNDCGISGTLKVNGNDVDTDNIFWCLEEEVTRDENCDAFTWEKSKAESQPTPDPGPDAVFVRCEGPYKYPECGDFCISSEIPPTSQKCGLGAGNGVSPYRGIGDCTKVGCKDNCWDARGTSCPGNGVENHDKCVGSNNKFSDTTLCSKIKIESTCTAVGCTAVKE